MANTLFGKRVREHRKAQNITLEQLASEIGVTPNFLGDIERGKKSPSFECLIRIINALNVSADLLLLDSIEPAHDKVNLEIAHKMNKLNPLQRGAVLEILDVVIENIQKLD